MYGWLMKIFSSRKCVDLHGVSTPFLYFFLFHGREGSGPLLASTQLPKDDSLAVIAIPRHLLWQYLRVI